MSPDETSRGPRERRTDRDETDFGTKLRQARERQGISLREIAISTKISITALEALERNDASRLPGGLFSRAFVRSYAAEVGLDPEQTVREFMARFPTEAASAPAGHAVEPPEEEFEFEGQRQMLGAMVCLVLISVPVAGIVLYYSMFRNGSREESGAGPADVVASSESAPAGPVDTPAPAVRPSVAPVAPAANLPAVANEITLEMKPSGPCWIAWTVDGKPKVSRLMQAGETQVERASNEIVLEVGDAGVFAFTLNNVPGRSLGGRGQVVISRITRENYRTYLRQ